VTHKENFYRLIVVLILVLPIVAMSGTTAVHAQIVGGTISGTVKDASGALLGGASVTVRQVETGATRLLTTDEAGRFHAPSVPVGIYSVTVAHEGFATLRRTGISVVVGQSLQLEFALGLDSVHQDVVVDATEASVNITSQQTSGLIDERQVKELPLNGRSYDQLLTLNPATVNYSGQRSGGIGTSNSSVGNMFSVARAASCWAWMRCASSTWRPTPMAQVTASAMGRR